MRLQALGLSRRVLLRLGVSDRRNQDPMPSLELGKPLGLELAPEASCIRSREAWGPKSLFGNPGQSPGQPFLGQMVFATR